MTKQVAYKALSEFWCWYGDVVKPLSTFTDDETQSESSAERDKIVAKSAYERY
jgi:hypothetical protein